MLAAERLLASHMLLCQCKCCQHLIISDLAKLLNLVLDTGLNSKTLKSLQLHYFPQLDCVCLSDRA